MFLKKFLKSSDTTVLSVAPPAGVQAMGVSLQHKFAKGINYNMKIVVRGDRNVGKSCLHLRLQGLKFKEEYIPTHQIEVASIHWNYKGGQDIIKVEVWDVVDKGKKKGSFDALKTHHCDERLLDAEFVDVYKGTHGVVLVFDITKQWTFNYVERELPKIPSDIPVLLLANHLDMGHHRTVTLDQVKTLTEFKRTGEVRVAESSMKDGFGLKYVHAFLNLPFLYLQKCSLLSQLQKNEEEVSSTLQKLQQMEKSDDLNYTFFKQSLGARRLDQRNKENSENAFEVKVQRQAPPAQPFPNLPGLSTTTTKNNENHKDTSDSTNNNKNKEINVHKNIKQNVTTKDFKTDKTNMNKKLAPLGNTKVEEYAPEVDDAYKDFLNDDKSSFIKSYQYTPEEDEEEDKHNPLVADFHDGFTSSDCDDCDIRKGCKKHENGVNALCQDDLKTRPEVLNGWLNTTSKDEGLAKTREGMLNGSVNANQKYDSYTYELEDMDLLQQRFLRSVNVGDTTVEIFSASTDEDDNDDAKKRKKKKKKENDKNEEDDKKFKKKIKSDKNKKSKKDKNHKKKEKDGLEEFLECTNNYEVL